MKITATATRDGRFWLVYVPEVDAHTQGRNLAEAQDMARDLAATIRDVPIGDVQLESFTVELPSDVRTELAHAEELREQAQRANSEAARLSRHAALRLRKSGLTVRDVGTALGVSYQRAHQLTK
ncbi:MAG: hypothetical protein QM774_12935 [Gordonia sp. (in: high G+C Gram-positive bacteria)]|uniref:type II toxin-antitoxin system HicB family antitoxin n=1 Tax=Gordonia sp. (in: high G+C Gram-positive bacteria) TaxID=84139 RepID=UPI0039E4E2F8